VRLLCQAAHAVIHLALRRLRKPKARCCGDKCLHFLVGRTDEEDGPRLRYRREFRALLDGILQEPDFAEREYL